MVAWRVARHTDVRGVITAEVGAAIAVEHTPFCQITHHLLGEERVPGGPLGDPGAQARTDGSFPSSSAVNAAVCDELSGAREIGVSTWCPRQRAPVLGAVSHQHQ